MPRRKAMHLLLSLATVFVPATAFSQSTYSAVPGSLNFVQGQANIDGQPLPTGTHATNTVGNSIEQPRQLQAGQTLATANGSADLLLAPGALLRIGENSTVRMVAADPNRTEVRLEAGRANASINIVRHDHLLLVDLPNGQTQLLSRGLYTLNADTNLFRVYAGEAYLFPGTDTSSAVKHITVKEEHEVLVGGDRAKPEKFDREASEDDLLPWVGPRETRAALADGTVSRGNSSGSAFAANGYDGGYGEGYGYGGGGYGYGYNYAGFYPGAFGFGAGYGPYGGWDSGYGFGPYGFGGYPFFGFGFGYFGGFGGGFYGGGPYGRYPVKGPGRFGNGTAGLRGGTAFHGGNGFAGGAAHGGGFGGGMHVGGGGGHR